MPGIDGVLVIDKPPGPTSHDVVATARRALRMTRVGHTGTLDPNASGVLPLVLGCATRLARYFSSDAKEYEATIRFGVTTNTYDAAGTVVSESGEVPSPDALRTALERFRGVLQQMPPAFSAKKIGGAPAYERARREQAVELEPVSVTVFELELLTFEPPHARIRVLSSAGFYVRSLAHDLGVTLGCGAMLDALRRTRAGSFTLGNALPFGVLASGERAAIEAHVIRAEQLLPDFPVVALTAELVRRVRNGVDLAAADLAIGALPAGTVRLLGPHGQLIGLAEPAKTPGFLHPAVVFS